MSDFLSNFDKDKYQGSEKKVSKKGPSEKKLPEDLPVEEPQNQSEKEPEKKVTPKPEPDKKDKVPEQEKVVPVPAPAPLSRQKSKKEKEDKKDASEVVARSPRSHDEETEFDPTFKKKQLQKRGIIIGVAVLAVALAAFAYYQFTHVKLPDFVGDEVADTRTWLADNGMKMELIQEFDETIATNVVLAQSEKADRKVKKGSTIKITASKGADPNAVVPLPDFMSMALGEAEQWKAENQANNLSIIQEYSDTVDAGQPLRLEIADSSITAETYHRKDKANLYYSRGKEVFEKNINVPDFVNKTKAEVETWVKTNEIQMTYEEQTSDTVAADSIISQNIAKDEKVAKRDAMTVVVSLGKGTTVPNFADYTPEDAAMAVEGLNLQVKTVFTENVPYGRLVSQSIEAGTELTAKDNPFVSVVYSAGQPYIRDIRGTMMEGDLPKYFFDEFQSKGANIYGKVRYVDSAEAKGTVVGMSAMNQYLPLDYTVTIDISRGNLTGVQTYNAQMPTQSSEEANF